MQQRLTHFEETKELVLQNVVRPLPRMRKVKKGSNRILDEFS